MYKKIIPCLDIKDGRTVKGVNFVGLKDAGDPVELAQRYAEEGADELVLLNIAASNDERTTWLNLVSRMAEVIDIPLIVGGGIHSLKDAQLLFEVGANKVSVSSAAVENPGLIADIAQVFGNDAVVLAIDAMHEEDDWWVYTQGGKRATGLRVVKWAQRGERLGAGALLLTSMERDGTKNGFELELVGAVARAVNIPIIASGGAGSMDDFVALFAQTNASAGLAASIFHYGVVTIPELRAYLKTNNIVIK